MSSSAAREKNRNRRLAIISKFCRDYNFTVEPLNMGYQQRVENALDLYPTNGKWHWLPTGERGDWDTANDLKKILLRLTENGRDINVYDVKPRQPMNVQWPVAPDFSVPRRTLERLPKPKTKWYARLWRKLWRRK